MLDGNDAWPCPFVAFLDRKGETRYHRPAMTQYKFSTCPTGLHYAHVSSLAPQQAREKRQQVLEAVLQRRKIISAQFMKKGRLQAGHDLATIG